MALLRPDLRPARIRRLAEELVDEGFDPAVELADAEPVLDDLAYALRPPVHERRIPSFGSIVAPAVKPDGWARDTQLGINRMGFDEMVLDAVRRFADGLSSWVVRRPDGVAELVVFDRPAGSERDLVVLAKASGATLVQRHPAGAVRAVGGFGVLRWDGIGWHHEPPITPWIDAITGSCGRARPAVLEQLLAFAVHDLGSRGIGAILVHRLDDRPVDGHEARLPTPPPLRIDRPIDLAPLRHVLAQVDGAAVFDGTGTLRELGVRLVPSAQAEQEVEGYRGMRHTAARRHSFDEPKAIVIVVSDDGPVTVLQRGELIGRSPV